MDRLKQLLAFLEEDPTDSFLQYSLAQEYIKLGSDKKAIETFKKLQETDPAYVGFYYHLAKALERIGELSQAMKIYDQGIERARAAGDSRAVGELQSARTLLLDQLGGNGDQS